MCVSTSVCRQIMLYEMRQRRRSGIPNSGLSPGDWGGRHGSEEGGAHKVEVGKSRNHEGGPERLLSKGWLTRGSKVDERGRVVYA